MLSSAAMGTASVIPMLLIRFILNHSIETCLTALSTVSLRGSLLIQFTFQDSAEA
jgi:hypothetical protein